MQEPEDEKGSPALPLWRSWALGSEFYYNLLVAPYCGKGVSLLDGRCIALSQVKEISFEDPRDMDLSMASKSCFKRWAQARDVWVWRAGETGSLEGTLAWGWWCCNCTSRIRIKNLLCTHSWWGLVAFWLVGEKRDADIKITHYFNFPEFVTCKFEAVLLHQKELGCRVLFLAIYWRVVSHSSV